MIISIDPALILQMLRTGNEIRCRVEEGITPEDYSVKFVRFNDGYIEVGLQHKNDDTVNPAPFAPVFTTLEGEK